MHVKQPAFDRDEWRKEREAQGEKEKEKRKHENN
jgi:hypothetical protein